MADPQRLRWWQEDQSATSQERSSLDHPLLPAEASVSEAEAIVEHDIGEELEAEARARALKEQSQAGQTLNFYTDKARSARLLRQSMWWVYGSQLVILLPLAMAVTAFHLGFHLFVIPLMFSLMWMWLIGAACKLMRRNALESPDPIIAVSPDGIRIRDGFKDTGVMLWSEIAGIHAQKRVGCSSLAIRLHDTTIRDRFQYCNERFRPRAPQPGRKAAPSLKTEPDDCLTISGALLPVDAEMLAARLVTYEAAAPVRPAGCGPNPGRRIWWQGSD